MISDILLSIIAAIGWTGCLVFLLLLKAQGPGAAPLLKRHVYFKLVAWSVLIVTQTIYYIQTFFNATEPAAFDLWLPVFMYEPLSSILFRGFLAWAMWDLVRNLMTPRLLIVPPQREAQIQMDVFGKITSWDEYATKLLGWTADEIVGQELADYIVPPQYREAHREGLMRYRETGVCRIKDQRNTFPALTKSGNRIVVDLRIKEDLTSQGTMFTGIVSPAEVIR